MRFSTAADAALAVELAGCIAARDAGNVAAMGAATSARPLWTRNDRRFMNTPLLLRDVLRG
jgi:hypothetical protein